MRIYPSLLAFDLLELRSQVETISELGVAEFHLDVMDGQFVPNLTFGAGLAKAVSRATDLPINAHLMVYTPELLFAQLKNAGVSKVYVHPEATPHIHRVLSLAADIGLAPAIAINPGTPLTVIEPVIDLIDYVVLMTVEPGYAGQKFMTSSLPRLSELVTLREKNERDFLISIDGGVDYPNAVECAKRGAEVYVTGIYTVFTQPEGITEACKKFNRTMREAITES